MSSSKRTVLLFALMTLAAVQVCALGFFVVRENGLGMAAAFGCGAFGAILLASALAYSAFNAMRVKEAHFRAIVERAADGIITTDDQGKIEAMNDAAEAIFGYRLEEVEGCMFTVLFSSIHPDDEEGDLWGFLRVNAIQATGAAHEVIGLRKHGEKFFMALSISQAEVGDRSIFVAVVHDITERKKNQIALRKARDELEQRVEERTEDLRNANAKLEAEIVEHKRTEVQRERLVTELQEALAQIKTLGGLIPICAACKKVRDDQGYWNQIEVYLRDHSEAEFSHGICPDCAQDLYPGIRAGRDR